MFRPNTHVLVLNKLPTRSIHGKETFGAAVRVPCAIVHIRSGTETSSVRADSTASRGAADSAVAMAVILFPPSAKIVEGDVVRAAGKTIEVTGIEPRFDVRGSLDHLQISGDVRTAV